MEIPRLGIKTVPKDSKTFAIRLGIKTVPKDSKSFAIAGFLCCSPEHQRKVDRQ
jgi:hypothetical protein